MPHKKHSHDLFHVTYEVCDGVTVTRQGPQFAREVAHKHFDRLWKENHMSRNQAYRWLRETLQLPKDRGHIRHLNVPECRQLVYYVQKYLEKLPCQHKKER